MNVSKRISVAAVVAVVALLGAALFGGVADAQKKGKKKGGSTVAVSNNTAFVLPGAPVATAPNPRVSVPLAISKKKGKGKVVAPSTVSITYSATGVAGKLDNVNVQLRAPNGRTIPVGNPAGLLDTAIGPYTETPNSSAATCPADVGPPVTPPCGNPDATVTAPYSSQPVGNEFLALFSGVPVQGTWQLQFTNTEDTAANISAVKISIKTQPSPSSK